MSNYKKRPCLTTNTAIGNYQNTSGKTERLSLGDNLTLRVTPNNKKVLCYRAKRNNKSRDTLVPIGVFGQIDLKHARKICAEMTQAEANGVKITYVKRIAKGTVHHAIDCYLANYQRMHPERVVRLKGLISIAERLILPILGKKRLSELTATLLTKYMDSIKILSADTPTVPRTVYSLLKRALTYMNKFGYNAGHLLVAERGEYSHVPTHHACLTKPSAVGILVGQVFAIPKPDLRDQVMLTMTTAARVNEIASMKWDYVDFDEATVTYPVGTIKNKRIMHTKYLDALSLEILNRRHEASGGVGFVFPSTDSATGHVSPGRVNNWLKSMGYKGKMRAHGFRGMFSTLMHEWGYAHEPIELNMAHVLGNAVTRAYDHSELVEERRYISTMWTKNLIRLRDGQKPLRVKTIAHRMPDEHDIEEDNND